MPNIDERLLAASNADKQRQQEMAYSDRLRQEKWAAMDRERQERSAREKTGEPRSLRQSVQAARQAMDLKAKAKEKLEEKVAAPAKAGTSSALRWAWGALIPSFGFSLIYINIHVFLRMVVGEKLFCKLGEEWLPKPIAAAGGEAGKMASNSIGIAEAMGLAMLDLLALFIVVGVVAFFAMIIDFMQAGFIKKVATIVGGLTNMSWLGIKDLFNLFAK